MQRGRTLRSTPGDLQEARCLHLKYEKLGDNRYLINRPERNCSKHSSDFLTPIPWAMGGKPNVTNILVPHKSKLTGNAHGLVALSFGYRRARAVRERTDCAAQTHRVIALHRRTELLRTSIANRLRLSRAQETSATSSRCASCKAIVELARERQETNPCDTQLCHSVGRACVIDVCLRHERAKRDQGMPHISEIVVADFAVVISAIVNVVDIPAHAHLPLVGHLLRRKDPVVEIPGIPVDGDESPL